MTAILGINPHAEVYPLLDDDELNELVEDIRENGLLDPITVDKSGYLLDGRNRYRACEIIGIAPDVVVYEGDDPGAFVRAKNVRRHQSAGSRAMSNALSLQLDGKRVDGRWERGSITQDFALSRGQEEHLRQAGIVLDYKPEISDLVVKGTLSLNDAYDQANAIKQSAERDKIMERERRKREREQEQQEAERDAKIVADLTQADATYYLEQIDAGHMKPVSAWAAYQAEHQRELDQQAAERRNDEQQVRAIGDILEHLTFLESNEQRAWYLRATKKYPDAMIERQKKLHTPQRIRELADALSTYATELEQNNVA